MYQGPWPALLRLPIVAVTSRFDGRLTQLSMVLATLVAMVGTAHLHWQVRRLLRPDAPVRRPDLLVAALATFVVGGGSALLYEASRAVGVPRGRAVGGRVDDRRHQRGRELHPEAEPRPLCVGRR